LRLFTPGRTPLERDRRITQDFENFISHRKSDQPFFGFLFYDSAHGYYAIPDLPKHFSPAKRINHIMTDPKLDPTPFLNLYRNALFEIDQLVHRVLSQLQEKGLLDSTWVVITGDHGQEFNDSGKDYWEHPSNFSRYQAQVPLVIHCPGRKTQHYHHLTTHYDVVPTLMQSVLGVTNPAFDYSMGHHLFDEVSHSFVIMGNYTHFGLVDQQRIINLQRDGHYQVYDHQMNHLETTQLNPLDLKEAMMWMERFYGPTAYPEPWSGDSPQQMGQL
jgi:membrane-anchored protein YejM (alkaline phosphatase superfamily)